MDLDKLERLARHVNSVSVNQDTVKRWIGEDGSENVSMLVGIASLLDPESRLNPHTSGFLGQPTD